MTTLSSLFLEMLSISLWLFAISIIVGGNQDDPLLPVNMATVATKMKSAGRTGEVEGEVKRLLQ